MKHILSILAVVLCCLIAWSDDTFNPANPTEPQMRFDLTVTAEPANGGSVSPSGTNQYNIGSTVNLRASINSGYSFVAWIMDGDTLSKSSSFTYTIPEEDSHIIGVFEIAKVSDEDKPPFNPNNPTEPGMRFNLTLTASPEQAGTVTPAGKTQYDLGATVTLNASTNSGYRFIAWIQGNDTISKTTRFNYIIPEHDSYITAIYEKLPDEQKEPEPFNPANPANPGANHWNATTGELIIDDFTPGNIFGAIDAVIGGSSNRGAVSQVIVSGQMSGNDFAYLNDRLTACSLFDLSRTGGYNQLPAYSFDSNANLNTIILSACVESIGNGALQYASNLNEIWCYAVTPPTLGSNVFNNISENAILRVLSSSIPLYSVADGWKDFVILPLTEEIKSIEVSFPSADVGQYKNSIIELQNTSSGLKQKYIVTDRQTYIFNGLIKNTTYDITLRSPQGIVLGTIKDIEVAEEDVKVAFENLISLHNIVASIITPSGEDITAQASITWLDANKNHIAQGNSLTSQVAGSVIGCIVDLPKDMAMKYILPDTISHAVSETENSITCSLVEIPSYTVSGVVNDSVMGRLPNVSITLSQKLNGKYSHNSAVKTDKTGNFTITAFDAPTTITISSTDYVSKQITFSGLANDTDLGTINLKEISGATIDLSFTYRESAVADSVAPAQEWWNIDLNNISFAIYNKTRGKEISQYSVQNDKIVLLEEALSGDMLQVTASSNTKEFNPISVTGSINADLNCNMTFDIVELGRINVSHVDSAATSVIGILYDSNGELSKKKNFSKYALELTNIEDGDYTLITMMQNDNLNSLLRLSQFPAIGLVDGVDYISNAVTVVSGIITTVSLDTIPELDETKFYHTSSSSFTTNKSSVVVGNYLTLKGAVQFKSAYASQVSDVNMIIDLPSTCSFVENSVMVGNSVSAYSIIDNTLTIPMSDASQQVKFCVIPTYGGEFTPSALIEFNLNGKTVRQPIGSAYAKIENLSIVCPSVVAKTELPISGTAAGRSKVEIYANDELIGETTATANGLWNVVCNLNEPYNLSYHDIYAIITTPDGAVLKSETRQCQYDINAIQVKSVTMINTAHPAGSLDPCEYVTVFDFMNPKTKIEPYWYWPKYPEFTFLVDLSNNDPEKVHYVDLYVSLHSGKYAKLETAYDSIQNKWIAKGKFDSHNLPANVAVDFNYNREFILEATQLRKYSEIIRTIELNDSIIDDYFSKGIVSEDSIKLLYDQLGLSYSAVDFSTEITDDIPEDFDNWSEAEQDAFLEQKYIEFCQISDSLINVADKYFGIDSDLNSDGYTYKYDNCDGLTPEVLIKQGYEAQLLTDGTTIYFKCTESFYHYVDFIANESIYITFPPQNKQVRFTTLSTSDTFDDVLEAIHKLENSIKTISDILEYIDEIFNLTDNGKAFKDEFSVAINWANGIQKICKKEDAIKKWDEAINRITKYRTKIDNILNSCKILKGIFKITGYGLLIIDIGDRIHYANNLWKLLHQIPDPCDNMQSEATNYKWECGSQISYHVIQASASIASKLTTDKEMAANIAYAVASGGMGWWRPALTFAKKVCLWTTKWLCDNHMEDRYHELERNIQNLDCEKEEEPEDDPNNGCKNPNGDGTCNNPEESPEDGAETPGEGTENPEGGEDQKPEDGTGDNTGGENTDKPGSGDGNTGGGNEGENPGSGDDQEPSVEFPESGNGNTDDKENTGKEEEKEESKENDEESGFTPIWPGSIIDDAPAGSYPYPGAPAEYVQDPSGFVYEGVESNRLKGVKTTAYYKEMVEDMYGDKHEQIVLWDATEYAQENPLFTDEYGNYAWDVPEGLWQVKYEKSGYQTAYSEWLPVPPPQLEVNIGLVQLTPPEVASAHAYEGGVDIYFSKFMNVDFLNSEHIVITRNDEILAGEIAILNEENKLASKVSYKFSEKLNEGDKILLTINKRVRSYANIMMESDFVQEFDILSKPSIEVADSIEVVYGQSADIIVKLRPSQSSAGKKITASSLTSMTTSITPAETTTDENGCATFTITGNLKGNAIVRFSVDDEDLSAETNVSVIPYENRTITRDYALQPGWNWISVNVNDKKIEDLPSLFAPIKEYINYVSGINDNLSYDADSGFVGSLSSISLTGGYKVNMRQAGTLSLLGKQTSPTITLRQGWNWIGYSPQATLSIDKALANLVTEAGDIVMGRSEFAVFDGSKWVGSLKSMDPGLGYMYYSQSIKSFNYPTVNAESTTPSTDIKYFDKWSCNPLQYKDNMTMVVRVIDNNGNNVNPSQCTVIALIGEECRGIASVDTNDENIFLTIHGDSIDKQISFQIYDSQSGAYYNAINTLDFNSSFVGSLESPVVLQYNESSNIKNINYQSTIAIFPNPVKERLFITSSSNSISAQVTDMNGNMIINTENILVNEGIDVSNLNDGTYIITIVDNEQKVSQKFVKRK
ncbi:MAG: T9SS type A sorting domain-containing protein [Muribaculaceae bacterium]|nr:T9SS type A sorting domain-containing protein [Muribaculaceae bacterium]